MFWSIIIFIIIVIITTVVFFGELFYTLFDIRTFLCYDFLNELA